MRITFIETRRMSEDGFGVTLFEEGKTYEVADTCAWRAIRNGWAYEPNPNAIKSVSEILFDALRPLTEEERKWFFADPFKKPVA
jgi:hypothetical protein